MGVSTFFFSGCFLGAWYCCWFELQIHRKKKSASNRGRQREGGKARNRIIILIRLGLVGHIVCHAKGEMVNNNNNKKWNTEYILSIYYVCWFGDSALPLHCNCRRSGA